MATGRRCQTNKNLEADSFCALPPIQGLKITWAYPQRWLPRAPPALYSHLPAEKCFPSINTGTVFPVVIGMTFLDLFMTKRCIPVNSLIHQRHQEFILFSIFHLITYGVYKYRIGEFWKICFPPIFARLFRTYRYRYYKSVRVFLWPPPVRSRSRQRCQPNFYFLINYFQFTVAFAKMEVKENQLLKNTVW